MRFRKKFMKAAVSAKSTASAIQRIADVIDCHNFSPATPGNNVCRVTTRRRLYAEGAVLTKLLLSKCAVRGRRDRDEWAPSPRRPRHAKAALIFTPRLCQRTLSKLHREVLIHHFEELPYVNLVTLRRTVTVFSSFVSEFKVTDMN